MSYLKKFKSPVFLRWIGIFVGFALLTFFVMSWRWGGTVADSAAYFDTARYLRGEIPASSLLAPYPYRFLVPAIAAALPGNVRDTFAAVNWFAVTCAALMIAMTVQKLGFGIKRAVCGGLLLVLSVPTFWYAPYLLVDPGSVAARAGFVLAVVSGHPVIAALVAIIATAIREENILLLVWLILSRQLALRFGLAALATAATWLIFVRWLLIPGLPSYIWSPSDIKVLLGFFDKTSVLSIVAGAGVVVPMAIFGWKVQFANALALKSFLALMVLPAIYAALSVRIDGRVIWCLYPMLIPFAIAATLKNKISANQLASC